MDDEIENVLNLKNACHWNAKDGRKKCMSDEIITKLKAGANNIQFNDNLDKLLMDKGGTIDELGFLLSKRTISLLGKNTILEEVQTRFKPVGPIDNELFNNFVIDNAEVIHLHSLDKSFLGVDVNLMDFDDYQGSLTQLRPSKNGVTFDGNEYKHFGCVLNTLLRSGNLKKVGHWVAMYGDFRNNKLHTIEYFNSSGNSAPKNVLKWMEQFAQEREKISGIKCIALNASTVQHQKSDTECGIYALYYILSRFVGIPYKKFREGRIPDDHVTKFRSKMFNDQKKVDVSLLEEHNLL